MNKLQVSFCGINLENPCLLASASPTQTKESIAKAFKMGWAGAVTKSCSIDEYLSPDTVNRFGVYKSINGSVEGFGNFEGLTQKSLPYWEQTIKELKEEFPSKVVIASIMSDFSKEVWQELTIRMQNSCADAIELNLSCPHFRIDENMGASLGKNIEDSATIVKWVKEVATVPIIAKLTPNITDIKAVAKAVVDAGADAIATINTVQGLIGVNIDTFEPLPTVDGYSAFGGYSGNAVKPIGLRCVAEIAQTTNIPIHGIGGISKWEDVIEYMAVGSYCIQICTAVMIHGFQIINPMLKGLNDYVEKKGFNNISEVTGKTIKKITSRESLNAKWVKKSTVVKPDNCIRCGKCVISCNESAKSALRFIDKKINVNSSLCDGCSLCTHVCSQGVLELR